ncbi:hypothetical protein PHYSODRAFT_420157, partial [Phytophthora sojae]
LVYETNPRQVNAIDCGIYMLHYFYKIMCHLDANPSRSLADALEEMTRGSFNVIKASRSTCSL